MPSILFEPFVHRQQEVIGLRFAQHETLNKAVRSVPGVKWSQTHRCWYIPLNEELCKKALQLLSPHAQLDTHKLRSYLRSRKKGANRAMVLQQDSRPPAAAARMPETTLLYKGARIHHANAHVLPLMQQQLILKGYSPSTIRTYLNEMAQLLKALKQLPADELTTQHLKRYLVYCFEKLGLKENTLHSRMNALKFYYEQVLGHEKFFWEIPRPKKQLILPKVLSDVEIGRMFRALTNLKHKAILFTAYSAGLRVSEVVNLKLKDIDTARMTLFIEKAKGKKDRVVNLSPLLLDILRAYIRQSNPRPTVYLFEGDAAGERYSVRSAQTVFLEAKQKAGISKQVSFHSLRHSFATHLLEKGVDIRYIKDILGHFNIKTTERYTHVSRRMLVNIVSPLDDLFSKGIL
jgi:site-specific recombinase XerD